MQVKTIGIKQQETGQIILGVNFDDDGVDRVWVPRWEDVRRIAEMAALIEYTNTKGAENNQLRAFENTAYFIRHIVTGVVQP